MIYGLVLLFFVLLPTTIVTMELENSGIAKKKKKQSVVDQLLQDIKFLTPSFNKNKSEIVATQLVQKYYELACFYQETNSHDEALQYLNKADQMTSTTLPRLLDRVTLAEKKYSTLHEEKYQKELALAYNAVALYYYEAKENQLAVDYLNKADKLYLLPHALRDRALVYLENSNTIQKGLEFLEKFLEAYNDPDEKFMSDRCLLGITYAGFGRYASKENLNLVKAQKHLEFIIDYFNGSKEEISAYTTAEQNSISNAYRILANILSKECIKVKPETLLEIDKEKKIHSYFIKACELKNKQAFFDYGYYFFLHCHYVEALSFLISFTRKATEGINLFDAIFMTSILMLYQNKDVAVTVYEAINDTMHTAFKKLMMLQINPFPRFATIMNKENICDLIKYIDENIFLQNKKITSSHKEFLGFIGAFLMASEIESFEQQGAHYLEVALEGTPSYTIKLYCNLTTNFKQFSLVERIDALYEAYEECLDLQEKNIILDAIEWYVANGYFRARWYAALIAQDTKELEVWLKKLTVYEPSVDCLRCVFVDDYVFCKFLDDDSPTISKLSICWPFCKSSKKLYLSLKKLVGQNSCGAMMLLAQLFQSYVFLHKDSCLETSYIDETIALLEKIIKEIRFATKSIWENYVAYVNAQAFTRFLSVVCEQMTSKNEIKKNSSSLPVYLSYLKKALELHYPYALHMVIDGVNKKNIGVKEFNFLFNQKLKINVKDFNENEYNKFITKKACDLVNKVIFKNYAIQERHRKNNSEVKHNTIICSRNDIQVLIVLTCHLAKKFFFEKNYTLAQKLLARAVELGHEKAKKLLDIFNNLLCCDIEKLLAISRELDFAIDKFSMVLSDLLRDGISSVLYPGKDPIEHILSGFHNLTTIEGDQEDTVPIQNKKSTEDNALKIELEKDFENIAANFEVDQAEGFNQGIALLRKLSNGGNLEAKAELLLLIMNKKVDDTSSEELKKDIVEEFRKFGRLNSKERNKKFTIELVQLMLEICNLNDKNMKAPCIKN